MIRLFNIGKRYSGPERIQLKLTEFDRLLIRSILKEHSVDTRSVVISENAFINRDGFFEVVLIKPGCQV